MRKENQSAHDRIEALITDLRVDFAEFAASRSGADALPASLAGPPGRKRDSR